MFEFIKSEVLVDWNANVAPVASPVINTPSVESVETVVNPVEERTNGLKIIPAKKKINEPDIRKETLPTRLKVCSTVPVNHFGPIPGIPVGTCWEKRIQVSEAGVHRPPVAGIHGREYEGAYSIVFSGSYPEDEDWGDEFYYSGCGGALAEPKKIISGQTCDQTLTNHNKALAMSCNAPVNDQTGAVAEDWKAGKPIRVVRTHKLRKHSPFAPDEGNRYDGIYKVVEYFPTLGKYGLLVWRFFLRRDDPEPAPWTDEGKKAIAEKNLQMIRAETTAYVKKAEKPASVYPFPDAETFDKIIRDALSATSDTQDEDTEPGWDWPSPKSDAQQSPKKKWTTMFTKSCTETENVLSKCKTGRGQCRSKKSSARPSPKNLKTKLKGSRNGSSTVGQRGVQSKSQRSRAHPSKQPSYKWTKFKFFDEVISEEMIGLQMGLPSANADNADPNLRANGSLESPRKRSRKQKFDQFLSTDPYEHVGYHMYGMDDEQKMAANAPIDHLTFHTSKMEKTDEYFDQSVTMEIVPDISFLAVDTSPEPAAKRNCKPKSNRSRKNGVARTRNPRRISITDFIEPIECCVDLTTEEEAEPYVLPANVEKFIDSDSLNKNIWEYCKKNFLKSETDFKDVVNLMFTCRYCHQLATNPVTTPCDHNACLECISNHFLKEIFSCPDCRNNLGPSFKIKENRNLAGALENLFPGYNLIPRNIHSSTD